MVLAFVIADAQNAKTVVTDSWDYEGVMDCTDDYVRGVETMVRTTWNSKIQIKYKGEYEGASGKHYSWSLVINRNWKNYVPGTTFNHTYVSTAVIMCEGEPIAEYKIRYHVTLKADGDIAVERYWDSGDGWNCL